MKKLLIAIIFVLTIGWFILPNDAFAYSDINLDPAIYDFQNVGDHSEVYFDTIIDGQQICPGGTGGSLYVKVFSNSYPDRTTTVDTYQSGTCFNTSWTWGTSGTVGNTQPFSLEKANTTNFSDGNYWLEYDISAGGDSYYYNFTISGGYATPPTPADTSTRFISIVPQTGTTTATTTSVGTNLYINPSDYKEGMYLSMSFTNQTQSLLGGSTLDAFNSATGRGEDIQIPLVSGDNNISTSTTFITGGRSDGKWKVVSPTFISSLPLIGFLFSPNELIATTSYFYVGFKSSLDEAVEQGGSSLTQFILTGTTTGANTILNCSNLLSGGLTPCLVSLVVPNATTLSNDFTRLRNGFLSVFPLGYLTRIIEIFSASTSAQLPVLSATIPNGIAGSGSQITLDLNHSLDFILNSTIGSFSNVSASSTQTFYQFTSRYWNILVYLAFAFYILSRILGTNVIPKFNEHGGVGNKPYGPNKPNI